MSARCFWNILGVNITEIDILNPASLLFPKYFAALGFEFLLNQLGKHVPKAGHRAAGFINLQKIADLGELEDTFSVVARDGAIDDVGADLDKHRTLSLEQPARGNSRDRQHPEAKLVQLTSA